MRWVTREKAKVDRIACPWLVTKFVDPKAEFLFVPRERVLDVAKEQDAIPYDSPGAELFHYKEGGDERCSFDAIIKKYKLTDPALLDMAEIVRSADAAPRTPRSEGAGLRRWRWDSERTRKTISSTCVFSSLRTTRCTPTVVSKLKARPSWSTRLDEPSPSEPHRASRARKRWWLRSRGGPSRILASLRRPYV